MSVALPPELGRLLDAADAASRDRAWEAFVAEYSRLLLHTARSICRDHDAAMDAYVFALDALRQDDCRRLRAYTAIPGSKFTTWLVMVARRLCLDQVRRRYGQSRAPGTEGEQVRLVRKRLVDLVADDVDPERLSRPAEGDPDAALRVRELEQALTSSLEGLEQRDRLLLALRFDDGHSAREIATIMRFPTPFHVYRRVTTVLGMLREALRRRGIEDAAP